MPLNRWNDDRIDDLANELSTLRTLPAKVAEHEVRLNSKKATLERHEGLIAALDTKIETVDTSLRARLDAILSSLRWTPTLKAAIAAPAIASTIAALAMVLTKGSG